MKVLVAYSSKTGSTKKVAQAVHRYDQEWDIKEISEINDADQFDYDLIIVGGWIDKGTFNKEAFDFANKLENKNVAFFFTMGAYPTGRHAHDCVNRIMGLFQKNNNSVLTHFHCQGAVNSKMTDNMTKLPVNHFHAPDKYRKIRWNDAKNHPNEEDLRAAESFANDAVKQFDKFVMN